MSYNSQHHEGQHPTFIAQANSNQGIACRSLPSFPQSTTKHIHSNVPHPITDLTTAKVAQTYQLLLQQLPETAALYLKVMSAKGYNIQDIPAPPLESSRHPNNSLRHSTHNNNMTTTAYPNSSLSLSLSPPSTKPKPKPAPTNPILPNIISPNPTPAKATPDNPPSLPPLPSATDIRSKIPPGGIRVGELIRVYKGLIVGEEGKARFTTLMRENARYDVKTKLLMPLETAVVKVEGEEV